MRVMLAALLLVGGAAVAQERQRAPATLPGIGETDPRRPVDVNAAPWRALGRVQHELGGRCTGALIGPRSVLTAAHCLVGPNTQRLLQPSSVHFLLGYDRGRFVAHGRVTAFRVAEGFDPVRRGPPGADWAVLTLAQPITGADRILALQADPPPPRTALLLGGYQQDRPEQLLADAECRVLGLRRGPDRPPVLLHDCAGTRGASGAPLLARGADGAWAVVGVVAGVAPDLAFGVAVPAGAIRPD